MNSFFNRLFFETAFITGLTLFGFCVISIVQQSPIIDNLVPAPSNTMTIAE